MAELERAIIEAARRLVHADAYGITWLDAGRRKLSVRTLNVPRGFVEEYEAFGRHNDALFTCMTRRREPVHDGLLFDRRAWMQQPICRFLHDWGFERCMQAPVMVSDVLQSTLHFTRGPGKRAFAARDLQAAELLHHRVARQLRHIIVEGELERTRKLCGSLLEHLAIPAVVTTASAALVHVNHAADLLLVSYRANPALWPEYADAVRANVQALAATGVCSDGRLATRQDGADAGYRVRTSRVEPGDLFLSLFHPACSEPTVTTTLAPREQVIANLVAQGYTNERIGDALNLSVNTIKDHLKRINRKLGTTNRAQVAAWAQARLAHDARTPPTA